MVVMKFGGASLRDCESLNHITGIIQENSFSRRAVVLSAVGGVTDCLLESIEKAMEDETTIPASLDKIESIHRPLIRTCISDSRIKEGTIVFYIYL